MKGPNIPHRWLAEKTAVFAIELADAFVSDLKACTRRIQTIQKHVALRRLQPKLLLILKVDSSRRSARGNDGAAWTPPCLRFLRDAPLVAASYNSP